MESNSICLHLLYTGREDVGISVAKESAGQCRRYRFDLWIRKTPCRRKWKPHSVFLLEKVHGQRILVGYSLRGCKESDTMEQLSSVPY